jgi:serine/threonine protein kinase/tetratricopeptide (TPR) repeat protein
LDADRYQRLKQLLFEANRLPASERSAFLDRECGEDTELRKELRSLLAGAQVDTVELQSPVDAEMLGASDLPEPPWHCGPYRIEREIGRGGMGVVFEARDLGNDARVAVKLVPPLFAAAPRFGDRFAREAEMGRQIDHPNVVRTLDFGNVTVRGRPVPYLVMEFVEGQNLRELLAELGVVPESLLREIADQVSEGLAAIHRSGIVHRDLKPENVLITEDRSVRIMDLGIAKLRDATMELTREGQFIGSLHYASPEQCGGGEIGPASDLYSLGVVLYELATGDNPFRRENPAAAIHAHLDHVAQPILETSPFFAELVRTLLEKDPERRFGSGAELREVLHAGERGTWWAQRRHQAGTVTRVRIEVPRRTPLIGRDDELRSLRESWDRAREGAGAIALVEGEAGVGKSRLVDEFLRGIGENESHVLYGSFLPGGGLRGLADAILAQFPAARLEEALEPYLGSAPGLRSTFAALLRGEALPEGSGEIFQTAAGRLLEGLARERPTVWVLEDLHYAPAAVWRIVHALARTACRSPAMLVLSARPPLDDEQLAALLRTDRLERMTLDRLDADQIEELVRAAMDNAAEAKRVGADVARKSDGNPLFALAIVSALRGAQEVAVPSEIRDLIAARLTDLDRDDRTLLDAAAVQGAQFDAELLAGVLGQPVVGVLQSLAELERSRGIVRAAGRDYRFDHNLVQEVLYAELPERLQAEYHTRLADAYAQQVEGEPWGVQAEFLARHYLAGVEPARALPHVSAALEHLKSRYLHEAALELIDRTLDVAELDERERFHLLLAKENLLYLLGMRAEQRETLTDLVQRAEKHGDPALRARAWQCLGAWHQIGGREPEALEAFERAVELAALGGDRAFECLCRTNIGSTLARMRRGEEALASHREALRIAEEMGHKSLQSQVTGNIGQALRHLSRYEESREMYERSLEGALEIESEIRERHAVSHLGLVHTELGNWAEAEKYLKQSIEFGRKIGSIRYESPATGNLGLARLYQGRLSEALELCRRHRAFTAEMGARRSEAVAIGSLGMIEMLLGHAERARTLLIDARKRGTATHAPQLVAGYEFQLGRVAILQEDFAQAAKHLASAAEDYRRIEQRDYLARTLIDLAAVLAADRKTRLEEAKKIGEDLDLPAIQFGVWALLGDEKRARAVDSDRIPVFERMMGRARLGWNEGAREIVDRLVANAPEEEREGMIERVPFYRGL